MPLECCWIARDSMLLYSRPKTGTSSCIWSPGLIKGLYYQFQHQFHNDARNRLSAFWVPTGGIAKKAENEDSHQLLIRAGFLRQAYSGVFHLLPLGLRVQEKLESLIDQHMRSLGASKVSLSSLSSQLLWERSGRLNDDSEVFRFYDRRDTPFLLAPTHEEEITTLVAGLVKSYKDLPLRVYQISRKYRDEPRPRQGLLRGREFLMKDLYTFDHSTREAMKTYDLVKETYMRLFDELKLPYIIAAADSGNMGGNLSHEFHFPSSKGEDTVISCSKCNYVFNEELVDGRASESSTKRESERSNPSSGPFGQQEAPAISTGVWTFISKDKRTLVRAYYPKYLLNENTPEPVEREVNPRAVRSIAACHGIDLDLGVKDSLQAWRAEARGIPNTESKGLNVLDIYDFRVRPFDRPPLDDLLRGETAKMVKVQFSSINSYPGTENSLDFIRIQPGDKCPKCGEPALKTDTAIELGHTFHLGTRYSDVLQATVAIDPSKSRESAAANHRANTIVPLQMGCHGIGVSRMISAVADMLADSKGLNWPRVMAPFSVVIIPGKGLEKEAEQVYDAVVSNSVGEIDAILDDRAKDFPWKLGDADLIGFPVILVLGRGWKSEKMVEVQCRRLDGFRTNVSLEELPSVVSSLLKKL